MADRHQRDSASTYTSPGGRSKTSRRQSNYYPSPESNNPPFYPPSNYRTRTSPMPNQQSYPLPTPRQNTRQFAPDHLVGSPPIPENLESVDRDTFNMDPDANVLSAAGAESAAQSPPPNMREGRTFFRGFMGGMRRAMTRPNRRDRERGDTERGTLFGVPPSDSDSGYATSPPTAGPSTLPPQQYAYSSSPRQQQQQQTAYGYSASPSTPSETLHGTVEAHTFPEAEPTAVGHELPSPDSVVLASPESVEPQYGPDYVKMEPPPPSDISLNTYIARIKQFFKDINELPWVAHERVTADYYPGRSNSHSGPRASHHPAISWQQHQRRLRQQQQEESVRRRPRGSLLLGSDGSSSTGDANGFYDPAGGVMYPQRPQNGIIIPQDEAGGYPPMEQTYVSPPNPNYLPVSNPYTPLATTAPVPAPTVAYVPATLAAAPTYQSPRYPGGYVSPEQHHEPRYASTIQSITSPVSIRPAGRTMPIAQPQPMTPLTPTYEYGEHR
ncbi:hypothetical protein BDQ12DRAFT_682499 [Crucibulum laeve]|uniref:Uncharacterized protein n=1 Tax=Crucibulum laeve TaxID=68775 RepID=A0A5C3M1K5_9AGAR|nr:hypothetical protein BDQ12DRAFT_682499 [Crucibulum laeve]